MAGFWVCVVFAGIFGGLSLWCFKSDKGGVDDYIGSIFGAVFAICGIVLLMVAGILALGAHITWK